MPNANLPAAFECMFCGDRMEIHDQTLADLHRIAREQGYSGHLVANGTALEAICPKCNGGPCPQCGRPVNQHELKDGKIVNCENRP
jgi:hypothetical protein